MSRCKTDSVLQCNPTSDWSNCRPWDLSKDAANCLAASVVSEQLNIAGAVVNVYKLLGVHEQQRLLDVTGNGTAISNGSAFKRKPEYAFDMLNHSWASQQAGTDIANSAWIGYDFGVEKLSNGRARYGITVNVRKLITCISIKQAGNATNRAKKVRIERSDDNENWFGVAVLTLSNDTDLHTYSFRATVSSRYWRIRALEMHATEACSPWLIDAIEMSDLQETAQSNIQDMILLENRNRDYLTPPISIKGYYDSIAASAELVKLGLQLASVTYQIKLSIQTCVNALGRPIVIGDIVELPSEAQLSADLKSVRRFLEVTDVAWDTSSYTPGWSPTILLVTAEPATASEETQDIFGDLADVVDNSGVFDLTDEKPYQDFSSISQNIKAEAAKLAPEYGADGSNLVREFADEELAEAKAKNAPALSKQQFIRTGMFVEDAIPQNGAPYTEGPTYPKSPKNGDYHRLTYEGSAKDIATQLYRFSTAKNKWIYLETDRRALYNGQTPALTEYLTSKTKVPPTSMKGKI